MAFAPKKISLKLSRLDLEAVVRMCGSYPEPDSLQAKYTPAGCVTFTVNQLAFKLTPKLLQLQSNFRVTITQSELSALNICSTCHPNPELQQWIHSIIYPYLNQI